MAGCRYHFLASVLMLGGCGRVGFDQRASDSGTNDVLDTDAPPLADCATYASAILCDDFEVDLGKWFNTVAGANEIVHDTGFGRSGNASAHVLAPEAGSARLIASGLGNLTSGMLHVRFYQWVPAGVVLENLSILHLVSDVNPFPGLILILGTSSMFVQATIDATNGPQAIITFPRDSWVCVRTAINIAASGGSVVTSLDGMPAATFTGNTLPPPNGYNDIHLGSFRYQSQPLDFWIDDVVVDTSPVPCD